MRVTAQHRLGNLDLDVDMTLPAEGVSALFGPSGSGKTTLLNIVAGFVTPQNGQVQFRDRLWLDTHIGINVPPYKRGVGYLFQDGRLFPHLDVAGNLSYADKRGANASPGFGMDDIITACDLAPLLSRSVVTLSGGELQRVALARTLLTRPDLLLFDEPLSALDRDRKAELLPFLENVPKTFGVPVIYVSHDIDEVSRIADRAIMIEHGRVMAFGPLPSVLGAQALSAARNPFEVVSKLSGVVASETVPAGLMSVKIGEDLVWLPASMTAKKGARVSVIIPARDVAISLHRPMDISVQSCLAGDVIDVCEEDGTPFCIVNLDVGGQVLKSQITVRARNQLGLQAGRRVYAMVKSAGFSR